MELFPNGVLTRLVHLIFFGFFVEHVLTGGGLTSEDFLFDFLGREDTLAFLRVSHLVESSSWDVVEWESGLSEGAIIEKCREIFMSLLINL